MAVYTKLTHDEIAGFLSRYDVGTLVSADGIAEGIENSNYLLFTSQKKYILTLFEKRVRESDLSFYLGLTEWLHERGIPCPRPIHAKDGSSIQTLKGKKAALIEFLEGSNHFSITPAHLGEVGRMIAKMHLAARDFPGRRDNDLSLVSWRHFQQSLAPRLDTIAKGLAREMEEEVIFLEEHWPKDLPSGVVHADLFPDNVFFQNGKLSGVIDFYFACNDSWMYDLLVCMNSWCFDDKHAFVPARAEALWKGYQEVRKITEEEHAAAPVLARGAAMRFLCTRAHDWLNHPEGAMVTRKDPMEYLAKLRFHRTVKSVDEYGI